MKTKLLANTSSSMKQQSYIKDVSGLTTVLVVSPLVGVPQLSLSFT